MTRRQRLERKLDKREEWGAKAKNRSDQSFDAAREVTEHIPFGQPILVGHHSEARHRRALARSDSRMRKGCEQKKLAEHHASKGKGLSRQLETSIFSDDTDAVAAIEARIAEREQERDRWKLYNTSCRTAKPDPTVLDKSQLASLQSIMRHARYQMGKNGQVPGYVLTNLGGNIRSDRERIKIIKARVERAQRAEDAGGVLIAKSGDYCSVTFAEKPAWEIRRALKAAGFGWSGGSWNGRTADLPAEISASTGRQPCEYPGSAGCDLLPQGVVRSICDACRPYCAEQFGRPD